MRKLKLDLDALEVTSFETEKEHEERGTVEGLLKRSPTYEDPSCEYVATCNGGYTCEYYTCAQSCYGTCVDCGYGSGNTACAICLID